jgi:hypothetical protein
VKKRPFEGRSPGSPSTSPTPSRSKAGGKKSVRRTYSGGNRAGIFAGFPSALEGKINYPKQNYISAPEKVKRAEGICIAGDTLLEQAMGKK